MAETHVDRSKVMKSAEEDLIGVMMAQNLNPAECLATVSMILSRFIVLATSLIEDDDEAAGSFRKYVVSLEPQFRLMRKTTLEKLPKSLRAMSTMAFVMGVRETSGNMQMHHKEAWEQMKRMVGEAEK